MKKITLLIFLAPLLIFAQDSLQFIEADISRNQMLLDQFSVLTPIAINPYLAIFITAIFSKFHIHNEFVASNPFFDSWVITAITGILFVATAIPKLIGDKLTGPIRTTINFLDNKAAYIITIILFATPKLMNTSPALEDLESSYNTMGMGTILIIFSSLYFLMVVMTVRLFLEILIFLSPIPIIDTFFEISKVFFTVSFIGLSIYSPKIAFIFSALIFLIALIFFRKAKRLITKIEYLVVDPILAKIFKSKAEIFQQNCLSFRVLLGQKTNKHRKNSVVFLKEENGKFYYERKRFLFQLIKEEVNLDNCKLEKNSYQFTIENESNKFIVSLTYSSKISELCKYLNIPIETPNESKANNFFNKLRSIFDKKAKEAISSV